MQFTGTVQSFDADEGVGYIVREPDRHEVVVRSAGLALGVDSLSPGTASSSTPRSATPGRRSSPR